MKPVTESWVVGDFRRKAGGKDGTPPEVKLEAGGEDRGLPEAGQLAGEPVGPGTAGGKLW